MTLKEKIKEWNETRGISVGAYLPLEKKHYIEIGEDIVILKDFDFVFPSYDAMVKTKVKGLALNSHSTRDNLATVKSVALTFGTENISFEFDFTNLILKIIINNYDEEESECVPLYNDTSFCSILESRNKYEELLKNIRNAGRRICDYINAEDLREIFEEWTEGPFGSFFVKNLIEKEKHCLNFFFSWKVEETFSNNNFKKYSWLFSSTQ